MILLFFFLISYFRRMNGEVVDGLGNLLHSVFDEGGERTSSLTMSGPALVTEPTSRVRVRPI